MCAFAASAVWVFLDARTRLTAGPTAAWTLGMLVAAPLVGAAYLITRPSRSAAWGLGEVGAVLLFFVTAIPLLGTVLNTGPQTLPSFWIIAALAVAQNTVFVAAALYVVRVKYHLPAASLGLVWNRWLPRLVQGAIAATAAVVGNTLGQNVTVYALGIFIGREAAGQLVTNEEVKTPFYRVLGHLHLSVELFVLGAVVAVVVPVGEEIFFRGLTYGALRRVLNRHLAVFVSALFFAAAHLEPVAILPIFILGVILAYLYDYTGSIIPGMIAHGVNNLAALASFYQASPPVP